MSGSTILGRDNVRQKRWYAVAAAAYWLSLTMWYPGIVHSRLALAGYRYYPSGVFLHVISLLLVVWVARSLPIRVQRPSQVLYSLLFVIAIVPSLTLAHVVIDRPAHILLCYMIALALLFRGLGTVASLKLLRVGSVRLPPHVAWMLIFLIWGVLHVPVLRAFGLNLNIVSLASVYDVRAEYKLALVAPASALASYGVMILAFGVNPLLIAGGFALRRWLLCCVGISSQLYIFGVAGFKSVLFSSAFLGATFFALKWPKWVGMLAMVGGIAVIAGGSLLCLLLDFDFLGVHFARRLLGTPGINGAYYFDYFWGRPKMMLAHSIFGGFADSQYSYAPPFLINAEYYAWGGMSSSTGNMWADAFANFGFLGAAAYTAMLGVVMWLYDGLTRELPLALSGATIALYAYVLSNTALLTAIVSYGLAIVFGLIFLLPRPRPDLKLKRPGKEEEWSLAGGTLLARRN